jgi:hypothetical protein
MFDSINDLAEKLAATGYFIDPVMTQVVFLAAKASRQNKVTIFFCAMA